MLNIREQESNDKLLLQQMQSDNASAFEALYNKYWSLVFSAACKRLKDVGLAQDIAQDIFLQLWRRRHELSIDNLPSYLLTSVRNNVLKWMAKAQRITPIPDPVEQANASSEGADAGLLFKEFLVKYDNLVKTLTPSQQEIFRMRYHQELSTAEIADQLRISRKTVQNQLGKSVSSLRQLMGFLHGLHILPILFL